MSAGDTHDNSFPYQRLSNPIQRLNAVLSEGVRLRGTGLMRGRRHQQNKTRNILLLFYFLAISSLHECGYALYFLRTPLDFASSQCHLNICLCYRGRIQCLFKKVLQPHETVCKFRTKRPTIRQRLPRYFVELEAADNCTSAVYSQLNIHVSIPTIDIIHRCMPISNGLHC